MSLSPKKDKSASKEAGPRTLRSVLAGPTSNQDIKIENQGGQNVKKTKQTIEVDLKQHKLVNVKNLVANAIVINSKNEQSRDDYRNAKIYEKYYSGGKGVTVNSLKRRKSNTGRSQLKSPIEVNNYIQN